MNNKFNALPAAVTDQFENMQLDPYVKKIFVSVMSDQDRQQISETLAEAAALLAHEGYKAIADQLSMIAERFPQQLDDEEI